jgi:hypothetical protein
MTDDGQRPFVAKAALQRLATFFAHPILNQSFLANLS